MYSFATGSSFKSEKCKPPVEISDESSDWTMHYYLIINLLFFARIKLRVAVRIKADKTNYLVQYTTDFHVRQKIFS